MGRDARVNLGTACSRCTGFRGLFTKVHNGNVFNTEWKKSLG